MAPRPEPSGPPATGIPGAGTASQRLPSEECCPGASSSVSFLKSSGDRLICTTKGGRKVESLLEWRVVGQPAIGRTQGCSGQHRHQVTSASESLWTPADKQSVETSPAEGRSCVPGWAALQGQHSTRHRRHRQAGALPEPAEPQETPPASAVTGGKGSWTRPG